MISNLSSMIGRSALPFLTPNLDFSLGSGFEHQGKKKRSLPSAPTHGQIIDWRVYFSESVNMAVSRGGEWGELLALAPQNLA